MQTHLFLVYKQGNTQNLPNQQKKDEKKTKKENQKLENYHKFGKRYAIFIAFYIWIIEQNSFCDWQIKAI